MNRGHEGTDIFYGNKNKNQFLDYLTDAAKKFRIRIFAYTVMNNHYHLVLENSSGKMSEFMKWLNGQYGASARLAFKDDPEILEILGLTGKRDQTFGGWAAFGTRFFEKSLALPDPFFHHLSLVHFHF